MRVLRPAAFLRAAVLGCWLVLVSIAPGPAAAEGGVGSVSGMVTSAGGPVANAWVTLTPVTPTGHWAGRPLRTTTDRDGRYVVDDVTAVRVKIQVRAPSFSGLASVYWPQAYAFATAGVLPVAASGSTADVALPMGGLIIGRVIDAGTADPVMGARVTAHAPAPPGWEAVGSVGLGSAPGQFRIEGLPPVPVALQVQPADGSNHRGQWYDRVGSYAAADRVEPGSTDILIRLQEGGEVSGVVRDDLGRAVPGAVVTLMGCPVLCPMTAVCDDEGRYRINGVPAGARLRAFADGSEAGLLSQWYATSGPRGGSEFGLAPGEVLGAVDFALTRGAVVTGRVLDGQTGATIVGASALLVDEENPLRSFLSRAVEAPSAPTSTSPTFTIGPVPPGVYSLIVYPGDGVYLPVQWVGTAGLDGAGRIDLGRGGRAEVSVRLARQGPSAGWPGLFGGFLTGEGSYLLPAGA